MNHTNGIELLRREFAKVSEDYRKSEGECDRLRDQAEHYRSKAEYGWERQKKLEAEIGRLREESEEARMILVSALGLDREYAGTIVDLANKAVIEIEQLGNEIRGLKENKAEIERLKGELELSKEIESETNSLLTEAAQEAGFDPDGMSDYEVIRALAKGFKEHQTEIERLKGELAETHLELKNALLACESAEEANRRYREEHERLGSPSNILIHAHAVGHGFHLHFFEDDRSILDYAAKLTKKGVHPDPRRISEMTWHPKKG